MLRSPATATDLIVTECEEGSNAPLRRHDNWTRFARAPEHGAVTHSHPGLPSCMSRVRSPSPAPTPFDLPGDTQAVSRFRSGCLALDAASRLAVDSRADCVQRADEADVSRQRPPMTVTGGDAIGWRGAMSGRRFLAVVATAMLIPTLMPAPVLRHRRAASGSDPVQLLRRQPLPYVWRHSPARSGSPHRRRDRARGWLAASRATRASRSSSPTSSSMPGVPADSRLGHRGVAGRRAHATGNLGAGLRVAVNDSGIDCDRLELAVNCEHGWSARPKRSTQTMTTAWDSRPGTAAVRAARRGNRNGRVAPDRRDRLQELDADRESAWSRHIAAIDDIWNNGNPTAVDVNMSIGRGELLEHRGGGDATGVRSRHPARRRRR